MLIGAKPTLSPTWTGESFASTRSGRLWMSKRVECQRVAFDQTQDRVAEPERVFAVVPAECGFVQVRRKVLDAELVVRADHAPVKEAPNALNRVRMNLAAHPLIAREVDVLMARVVVSDTAIGAMGVRVDRFGVVMHHIGQESLHGLARGVRSHAKPNLTSALNCPENDGLVAAPPQRVALLGAVAVVPVAELAADVGLVGLHDPAQERRRLVVHRGPDAVAEIPGGLVADSEHPLQLIGADALLRLAHDVDGEEPLPQRELGVVKEGAHTNAELIPATVAVELPALRNPRDFVGVAARTFHAVRPAKLFKKVVALVLGAELFEELYEVHLLLSHEGGLLDG